MLSLILYVELVAVAEFVTNILSKSSCVIKYVPVVESVCPGKIGPIIGDILGILSSVITILFYSVLPTLIIV